MDWNNYFMSRSNQNFNFLPGGYAPTNRPVYQNNDQNWQYYGNYNQNYISEPSSVQHVIHPLVSNPYGGPFTSTSRDAVARSGMTSFPVTSGLGRSETFNTAETLSSIVSASSLTPTAGEFVPRSQSVKQTLNEVCSSSNDSCTADPALFSHSQLDQTGLRSVNDSLSLPVAKERGSSGSSSSKKKNNNTKLISNSNSHDNVQHDVHQTTSCKKKGENGLLENVDNNAIDFVESESHQSQSNNKSNISIESGVTPENMLNSNADNTSKSEKDSNFDESKVVLSSNTTNTRQGQGGAVRKGSGRIPQSRMNENPRGSNIHNFKTPGRQNVPKNGTQAATFYSSAYPEARTGGEKGNGSRKISNDKQLSRDSFFGKNTREQNDRHFNNGKGFYSKSNNKVDTKTQEGSRNSVSGPVQKEKENNVYERTFFNQNNYKNDKNDKPEREKKYEKYNRFSDRQERGIRQDRDDRTDWQTRRDGGDGRDRQERTGRQDWGDRQDRAERQDWGDRQDRAERQDWGDRQDRGQRQEANYIQERGRYEKQDRDKRLDHEGRSVRGDQFRMDEGVDRSDRPQRGRFFRDDKHERKGWADRSGRSFRGDWVDKSNSSDKSNWMNRGDRQGRGDRDDKRNRDFRSDKSLRSDNPEIERNDRSDRNDSGKQKTFFSSRFTSKNFESSSGTREECNSNVGFFQSRGQKYMSNQYVLNKREEKERVQTRGENSSLFDVKRPSPEGESKVLLKYSNRNDACSTEETSHGFDRDEVSMVSSSPRIIYSGDSKMKNLGHGQFHSGDDDASQRERLSDQLSRGTLECLVCCERVRQHDATWSCSNCYHVLHLRCIKKWAKSSKVDSGWRCPACQNVTSKVPQDYKCFCGKMRDPEWNRQDLPHTCGEMCGRIRKPRGPELGPCTHRCTLLCHPGPCPPCVAQVNRNCGCGKTKQIVSCGSSQPLLCEASCDKKLNCGLHHCVKSCHWGPCGDCEEIVKQVCFCGKDSREVPCTAETASVENFSCEEVCAKELACGNHSCLLHCHEGPCAQCELTPSNITHCPCGKMPLAEDCKRTSCLDPIPTCGQLCGKKLPCGQPGNHHECEAECHTGPCPVCPLTTVVKCRCGHMDREIQCKELKTKADDARCEKRCSKKRACGKHKCNQACCIDVDHVCPLPCNHTLSCGLHKCEELCHRGYCQPCWRTSFEELYCECGANVIYPPVPCGTRRPACNNPCSRRHPCEHQALHQCHSEPTCPPCTVLMERYCYGKHELRKAVPCHRTEFSCGMPCGLPLPCGRHLCILPCHKGPCVKEGQPICVQPCKTSRSICGHPCAAPCHDAPCPDTPCKETVRVTCECGHRSTTRPCCDQIKEYRRVMTTLLASKMQDVQQGLAVDISDLSGNSTARAMSLKTLECNDECRIIERNRRLAIGLQIRNPDLSSKLQPRYSEFMRQWGKKDPFFVTMVHEKLTELVQLAKQSKQKSRSYSFSSMNREKRQLIHEYCEHFGCESQAYDPEPNRNVVATAQRDKAWLPSMSLLEVLQRESGQRKVPKPVTARAVDTKIRETNVWQSSSLTKSEEASSKSEKESSKEPESTNNKEKEEEIDYFEMTS